MVTSRRLICCRAQRLYVDKSNMNCFHHCDRSVVYRNLASKHTVSLRQQNHQSQATFHDTIILYRNPSVMTVSWTSHPICSELPIVRHFCFPSERFAHTLKTRPTNTYARARLDLCPNTQPRHEPTRISAGAFLDVCQRSSPETELLHLNKHASSTWQKSYS